LNLALRIHLLVVALKQKNPVYIYIQGWKSIHNKYKACQSKCKHTRGKPKNKNSSNEEEDLMLKGHPLPQIN
jgi:hypothetical protein